MTLNQALSLASLLIEFEIETPAVQPPPEAWISELRAARETINEAIGRPDPGEFFISAQSRGDKIRGRKPDYYVIAAEPA